MFCPGRKHMATIINKVIYVNINKTLVSPGLIVPLYTITGNSDHFYVSLWPVSKQA